MSQSACFSSSRTLYDKRAGVLTGKVAVAKGNDGAFTETPAEGGGGGGEGEEDAKGTVGVPGFWLRAMMNHGMLQETVAEEDVAALEYLDDVRCVDKEDYTVRLGWFGVGSDRSVEGLGV